MNMHSFMKYFDRNHSKISFLFFLKMARCIDCNPNLHDGFITFHHSL